jgi:hypothetical protein
MMLKAFGFAVYVSLLRDATAADLPLLMTYNHPRCLFTAIASLAGYG